MDKKGVTGDRSTPRSASRTFSLFNSIINLSSSSSGVRADTPQQQQLSPTTSKIKRANVSTSKKKKGGNQSPSSCSSVSSSGGYGVTMNAATLVGPAPKTFSILTALNELAISDREAHNVANPRQRRLSSPSDVTANTSSKSQHPTSIRNENSSCTSSSTGTFHQSPHHHQMCKPGEKIGRSARKQQTLITSRDCRENERISRNEWNKSKERTPEWIWKIFQLTKHGRLQELQQSLKGLDPTLIRHLADAGGNTLLHKAARGGHLSTLQWLVSILGPYTETSLTDHNRAGRTPIVAALKKGGRLKCFQWLVLNTKAGDTALVPKDGEKSLLAIAASYGNAIAVRWLSQLLNDRGVHVDIKDASTMTPLHIAAKAGYVLVCHELILAGADPFYQTELGWRPIDLAIRHKGERRMECVNYFMMVETAASMGNELHLLGKEFQALQQEHDSLRSHFRELLRVGKWLVKERTDLIKNFPSIGTKSSEGSILLGEASNGTRFSELEHKLQQAEQGWKELQANGSLEPEGTLVNGNSYNFQKSLSAAQSRCDKILALSASSSSDEESCRSAPASSSDEDEDDDNIEDHSIYPITNKTQNHQYQHLLSKSAKSTVAPWLLPPNDTFLAQLSPLVSQVDLLGSATTSPIPSHSVSPSKDDSDGLSTNAGDSADPSLVSSGTTTFYRPSSSAHTSSNVEATVLEVIEPSSVLMKGAYFTPDLILETNRCTTDNPDSEWLESQGGAGLGESVYSEIKGSCYSSSPGGTSIKTPHTPIDELLPKVFEQKHKKHPFPPLSNKCQNPGAFSYFNSTSSAAPHHELASNSNLVTPAPPLTIKFLPREKPSEDDHSNFSNQTIAKTSIGPKSNDESSSSLFAAKLLGSSSNSSKVAPFIIKGESTIVIDQSPKLTFPVLTSVEFSSEQLDFTGSQDEISCDHSSQVPPESVSTSNTPVMRRSFSSGLRSSSTVLFPLRKGNWVSPECLSSMNTESSSVAGGRLSPSLSSEASKTESALAPPRSNASHASNNSEGSKTESARGVTPNTCSSDNNRRIRREVEYRQSPSDESESKNELVLQQPDHQIGNSTTEWSNMRNPGGSRRKDEEDDESRKVLGSVPSQNVQAVQCIMHPLISSGIHKGATTIERVTKSGRGQAKPWYEVEGSDDDEGSLLRTGKSRSSRSSKLSTSSLSNSESEIESETSDEHECNSSCPRHNCPDFV